MTSVRLSWITAATALGLVSCTQSLPDVADFDRSYQKAEEYARAERADLERRRGQMSEADYQREKQALDNRVAERAVAMVWTRHSLEETQRENQGLPSPDHPHDINVPQAGSLPTGSDYRRFNQQMDSSYGTTGESISGMRQMIGNTAPNGSNIRGKSTGY